MKNIQDWNRFKSSRRFTQPRVVFKIKRRQKNNYPGNEVVLRNFFIMPL